MMTRMLGRIPKLIKYIAIGLILSAILICVGIFYAPDLFSIMVDEMYDPPGGCLLSETSSEVEISRYFDLPGSAENIIVTSDRPSTDICYIMVSFLLSPMQVAAFLDQNAIQAESSPFSGGGFWYGARVAGWPLSEGSVYMHGPSSKRDMQVIYHRGTMYVVIIRGN